MAGVKTCTLGNKKCSQIQSMSEGLKILRGSKKQVVSVYCFLDSESECKYLQRVKWNKGLGQGECHSQD